MTLALHRMEPEEVVSGAFWAFVGVAALRAVLRTPRAARGVWLLVTACCAVFVGDKVFDFQSVFFDGSRSLLHRLIPSGLRAGHQGLLRYLVLLPLVAAAIWGVVWLARQDLRLDRPKLTALAGICGIVLYVGLRLLPPVGDAFDGFRGFLVEGPCGLLVLGGVLSARSDARSDVS